MRKDEREFRVVGVPEGKLAVVRKTFAHNCLVVGFLKEDFLSDDLDGCEVRSNGSKARLEDGVGLLRGGNPDDIRLYGRGRDARRAIQLEPVTPIVSTAA